MRTKKILSVLMALLILAATFGMAGVFAEDEAAVEAAGEIGAAVEAAGEISAQAAARSGWGTDSVVELSDETSLAGAWNQGLIQWTPFTEKTATETVGGESKTVIKQESFANYTRQGLTVLKWEATAVQYMVDGDGYVIYEADGVTPKKYPEAVLPIESSSPEASRNYLAAYQEYTGSMVQLTIKQGKTKNWYGEIRAKLTVTAPTIKIDGSTDTELESSKVTRSSEWILIYLRDSKAFKKKIDAAQKILDKGSRYDEDFIKDLQIEVNIANMYLGAYPKDATRIDATLATLTTMVDAAPGYVVISNADWLESVNNWLPKGLIRFIWAVVDVFTFGGKIFGLVKPALSAIGSFFGAIFKIFNLITPLFSLFTGLFGA